MAKVTPAAFGVRAPDRDRAAEIVLGDLSGWGYPPAGKWPARPEALRYDDWDIASAAKRRERDGLGRLSRDDREQLQLFGLWRSQVLELEERTARRLWVVLSLIHFLEGKQPGLKGRALAKVQEDVGRFREMLRLSYRIKIPTPAPNPATSWVQRFTTHFGRNLELLPPWLRTESSPPDGVERRLGYDRDEADEDQGALSYVE